MENNFFRRLEETPRWEEFKAWLKKSQCLHVHEFIELPDFLQKGFFEEYITENGFQVSQDWEFGQTKEYRIWSIWRKDTGFVSYKEEIEDSIVKFFKYQGKSQYEKENDEYPDFISDHHIGI